VRHIYPSDLFHQIILSPTTDGRIFMNSTGRAENKEARRIQVTEFANSGMTAKAWCEKNNLNLTTLRYWQRRLADDDAKDNKWVDIAAINSPAFAHSSCTAIVPASNGTATVRIGAFVVAVDRTTDTEALRKALTVAASLC